MMSILQFLLYAPMVMGVAYAQSTYGTIMGYVTDPFGSGVPKAKVMSKNTDTNVQRQVTTDDQGLYRLTNLEPGEYLIEAEASSFRRAAVPAARLGTAGVLRVDFSLELGQITDSVTVTAPVIEVNTGDPQLGKTFREVSDVPLLSGNSGRNVLLLLGTQPGVIFDNTGGLSVNGQRSNSNSFVLDGADSTDIANRQPDSVDLLSPNAISELRLITGVLKAEYGRNSGGSVMVTTKSGSNVFHGVASEILRNSILNAVPFFAKSVPGGTAQSFPDGTARKPQWNGNDFDANLGGPLVRDKTFLFVSYLGFRRRQGDSRYATVPSDAQRAAIEAYGVPEAKALLALIPRPLSGATYFSAPSNALDRDGGLAKLDRIFSVGNQLSALYFIDDQRSGLPFNTLGGNSRTGIPGFGIVGGTRRQNVVVRDSHSLSANRLNEFLVSYHRNADASQPLAKTDLRSLGLTGIVPDDPSGAAVPFVQFSSITSIGTPIGTPGGLQRNTWQFLDNFSWVRGRHSWKFGGEVLSHVVHTTFANYNSGWIQINGTTNLPLIPGLPQDLSDFARGYAVSFTQGNSLRAAGHTRSIDWFAQDDWKIRRNLTLNLGVRWEHNAPFTDQRNRFVALRPGQQSSVFPDSPVGLVYPGDAGVSRSTYRADWNNFGPRLGFAWDIPGNGKLAIRGGYGLLYDNPDYQFGAPFQAAPPFNITASVLNTRFADPWASATPPIPQPFPFRPRNPGERFDFAALAPIKLGVYDPNFATPYTQQWSLQVQRQLSPNWLVEAAYIGSQGVRLLAQHQLNPAILTTTATSSDENFRRVLNIGNPQDAQYRGAVFGSVTSEATDANSTFHSLQLSLARRFSNGFQVSNSYTWSHSIDNASSIDWGGTDVSTRTDSARADRGNSNFDVRHRYVLTYLYELPYPNRVRASARQILAGWRISGITTMQTGLPFNVTDTGDRCLCGSGGQRPDYIGAQVRFVSPRSVSDIAGRPNSWFDGTIIDSLSGAGNPYFRRVGAGPSVSRGAGRFGNFGRNVFHGPGIANWDFAVYKRFRAGEVGRIDFRAEFLNVFNHAQFLNPVAGISNPNFGRIVGTRDSRIVQLSLRYAF